MPDDSIAARPQLRPDPSSQHPHPADFLDVNLDDDDLKDKLDDIVAMNPDSQDGSHERARRPVPPGATVRVWTRATTSGGTAEGHARTIAQPRSVLSDPSRVASG